MILTFRPLVEKFRPEKIWSIDIEDLGRFGPRQGIMRKYWKGAVLRWSHRNTAAGYITSLLWKEGTRFVVDPLCEQSFVIRLDVCLESVETDTLASTKPILRPPKNSFSTLRPVMGDLWPAHSLNMQHVKIPESYKPFQLWTVLTLCSMHFDGCFVRWLNCGFQNIEAVCGITCGRPRGRFIWRLHRSCQSPKRERSWFGRNLSILRPALGWMMIVRLANELWICSSIKHGGKDARTLVYLGSSTYPIATSTWLDTPYHLGH